MYGASGSHAESKLQNTNTAASASVVTARLQLTNILKFNNAKAEMLMKCKRKRNKYQQAPAYQPGPWPFNNTTNPILSQQTNCHDVQSI
jgi:hypothetical protein